MYMHRWYFSRFGGGGGIRCEDCFVSVIYSIYIGEDSKLCVNVCVVKIKNDRIKIVWRSEKSGLNRIE